MASNFVEGATNVGGDEDDFTSGGGLIEGHEEFSSVVSVDDGALEDSLAATSSPVNNRVGRCRQGQAARDLETAQMNIESERNMVEEKKRLKRKKDDERRRKQQEKEDEKRPEARKAKLLNKQKDKKSKDKLKKEKSEQRSMLQGACANMDL